MEISATEKSENKLATLLTANCMSADSLGSRELAVLNIRVQGAILEQLLRLNEKLAKFSGVLR